MKPIVTIASICVIIAFIYVARCNYLALDALSPETPYYGKPRISSKGTCETLLDTFVDRITHDTLIANPTPIAIDSNASTRIDLHIKRLNNECIAMAFFIDEDFVFISKNDFIYFILKDGSNIKYSNNYGLTKSISKKIDGYHGIRDNHSPALFFDIYSEELINLINSEIQAIRITEGDSKYEADFSIRQLTAFEKVINCLIKV